MKKLFVATASTVAVGASFLMTTGAFAFDAGNINTADDLRDCLANSGITCKLSEDITLDNTVDVTGVVTLDLNGKKILADSAFSAQNMIMVHRGGNLTINDAVGTGSISGETGTTPDGYGGKYPYSVVALTAKTDAGSDFAELTVNGGELKGYYYAIVGNGSRPNTKITINGGKITGFNEDDSQGIYHPQDGTLTVNGGVISGGSTGVEMRAGELIVNGGSIIGRTTEETVAIKNGSGSTTKGAGVAVVQHSTDLPITVTVKGGGISGTTALFQKNVEERGAAALEKISLSVQGGVLTGETAVYSENFEQFISGGTFSTEPNLDYIAGGYAVHKYGEAEFVVEKINGLENGDRVQVTNKSASDLTEEEQTKIEELKISGIQIAGVWAIDLFDATGTQKTETDNLVTFSFDVTPEMVASLKDGYTRTWYMIRFHNGEVEKLPVTVDLNTMKATFQTAKFSTYVLAYTDEKNAEVVVPKAPESGVASEVSDAAKNVSLLSFVVTIAGLVSAMFVALKARG